MNNRRFADNMMVHAHMRAGIPLIQLGIGGTGRITGIHGGEQMRRKLIQMGLLQGCRIEVINIIPHGPLVLKVEDTRIILGWGMARRIFVQPEI